MQNWKQSQKESFREEMRSKSQSKLEPYQKPVSWRQDSKSEIPKRKYSESRFTQKKDESKLINSTLKDLPSFPDGPTKIESVTKSRNRHLLCNNTEINSQTNTRKASICTTLPTIKKNQSELSLRELEHKYPKYIEPFIESNDLSQYQEHMMAYQEYKSQKFKKSMSPI